MKNNKKTEDRLRQEIKLLQRKIAELEKREHKCKNAVEELQEDFKESEQASARDAGSDYPTPTPSSSSSKPEVADEILVKWQKIVHLMARLVVVPAGLIMKVHHS